MSVLQLNLPHFNSKLRFLHQLLISASSHKKLQRPASVTNSSTPPRIADGTHCRNHCPNMEYSDMEHLFDCKPRASDFSKTELDALEATGSAGPPQHQLDHFGIQEKGKQKELLSSGSEEYEDAPLSESSDEEFVITRIIQRRVVIKVAD